MEQFQIIKTLRIFSRVFENKILIELPENLNFQEAEVIIIPKNGDSFLHSTADKDEWKKDFLAISKWDI